MNPIISELRQLCGFQNIRIEDKPRKNAPYFYEATQLMADTVESEIGYTIVWTEADFRRWEPKSRLLLLTTPDTPVAAFESLLHEFCHFIVATPRERRLWNLGLDGIDAEKKRQAAWSREDETLMLEWWLAQLMGWSRELIGFAINDANDSGDWRALPTNQFKKSLVEKLSQGSVERKWVVRVFSKLARQVFFEEAPFFGRHTTNMKMDAYGILSRDHLRRKRWRWASTQ